MKTNIKTLINQVKKALTTRSCLPEAISNAAYINNNGDMIAHKFLKKGEIYVFIAGIVQDLEAREKLYNKDALTLAADTGIFKGGYQLPEAYDNLFTTPADDFKYITSINADDFKAAAYTASKDATRPILTCIHLSKNYLESCDGFRAYRKKIEVEHPENLDRISNEDGLNIHAAVAAYGFKGNIGIYNGDRYIKLIDQGGGIVLFVRKFEGNFINMEAIYTGQYKSKPAANVTIKNKKEFAAVLKTAISSNKDRRKGITIRARKNYIDYCINALDIFGSLEANIENINLPDDYYITVNPQYLFDAVMNQGGEMLVLPDKRSMPIYCNGGEVSALVLPIRDDLNPFEKYDQELKQAAEKEAAAIRALNEKQHAENHYTNIGEKEIKAEIERQEAEAAPEAPAADPEKPTPTEAPANTSQEAPTEAATPEKLEIVKREEITPPEVVKARSIYKQLKAANFTPTTYQEAEAEAIYKNNRDKLQPIARRAGGLYIDTLAIIAAVMTIPDELI